MLLVWGILGGCTLFQVAVYVILFSRLAFFKERSEAEETGVGVSVVICARDEVENLRHNLPFFLSQQYAPYEIVVVNDGSKDGTREYLQSLQRRYAQLRVIDLPVKTAPGKKAALTKGILESRYEVLLLSDADCCPASASWIARMIGGMSGSREIVLGFSPYEKAKGFLSIFIRFEGMYTALQYLSCALAGMPYMGVGRNLLYKKAVFAHAGGFGTHLHKASGDDDLFVNAVANKKNTAVLLHPESFIWSKPPTTWQAYFRQKSRHFSTGVDYRWPHKILLGSIALTHALHYTCICLLPFLPGWGDMVLTAYLVRMAFVLGIYFPVLKKLGAPDLWKWVPILDAFLPIFYFVFSPYIFSGKSPEWKHREFRTG